MRAVTFISALAALVPFVDATALKTRSPYALKDTHFVPSKWTRVGPATPNHLIDLQIGLQQSQFNELERHLYEVSDPAHARYGQHLSEAEVNELVKPSEDTADLVHEWLQENEIQKADLTYSAAKDWIKVTLPVSAVERLLDTSYSIFEHTDGGRIVRTTEWSLPLHLHDHIATIQPTNSFFRAAPQSTLWMRPEKADLPTHWGPNKAPDYRNPQYANPNVSAVCNSSLVTPLCLRTYYGTLNYTVQAAGKNQMALNDFLGETNNRSDTYIFLEDYRPEAAQAAYQFTFDVINGGSAQQTPNTPAQNAAGTDLEGNLDVETMLGIAWPTPLTAFTTGGSPPYIPDLNTPTNTNEPYLTWLQYALALSSVPQVISTSYDDDEQTVPYSYAVSICNGLAQLGARGVSVFFSSGDSGVGPTGACYSNDGKNTSMFIPNFPSTCPYVTSVGATKNFNPEVAALDVFASGSAFTSGGGYSNYFPRPAYQQRAVSAYTASLGGLYAGLYNKSGRAIPDIAAQGQRFATIWNGQLALLDGTSASSPLAAAIFALVNDALIAAGRPPMGFLNPWLYSRGHYAFNDILNGSSAGCGTNGFPAERGWDAVTGWGTPMFARILETLGLNSEWNHWHGWTK